MVKFLILGAGITGLATAYNLKKDYFLAEKEEKVGGLAKSIEKNGFIFDFAEHFFRIPNNKVKLLFDKILEDNLFYQELNSAIYLKGKYITYPFQENLRDLPIIELKKCAKSIISNHFLKDPNKKEFENFEEYIYYNYGEYIAEEFLIPYNSKIWCISPKEMDTSWFLSPNFIPSFKLEQILNSILPLPKNYEKKSNLRWYPKKGGSQELANSFLPYLSHLALNHNANLIDINEKIVTFKENHLEHYEKLVSTIPLPELLKIIEPLPFEIKKLIPELKFNSVYCMNLCLNQEKINNYHWLYFPQKEIPFSRLFFSNNFSKNNVPEGKSSCSAVITYLLNSDFNSKDIDKKSIESLIEIGILKDDTGIIEKFPLNIKYGFTIPTIGLSNHLAKIQEFLKSNDIYSIGRYGEWKYSGIEHAIEDGEKISKELLKYG